ncbi:MAG: C4-dicarboxylate ABC transporter [Glaciimonas sp.]|nr:C4-dicarboxylate ABC transporter [Glaciimonas sp.]
MLKQALLQIRFLYPGYFALVMATGIISNALMLMEFKILSDILFIVNLLAYPWLLFASTVRVMRFRAEYWNDLINPKLVFSFFTVVAASSVFGIQLLLRGYTAIALGLWLFGLVAWVLLSYFSFSVLIFLNNRHGVDVIHGGWLIAIVGTESLVLLGIQLTPYLGSGAALMFVVVNMLWGIGIAFYGIFITLFSYRLFFLRVEPVDVTPLFWVVMGAAAISVNAGSSLLLTEPGIPFLLALRPFVEGTILILWAWSTWWIPLLIVFGIWKYVVHQEPLHYHPMLWSVIFPLGMYSLATYRLSLAADFLPLQWASRIMIWIALGAWLLTMYGALGAIRQGLRVRL